MLERCRARNQAPGPSFVITASGFEEMWSWFEPLAADEPYVLVET